MQIDRSLSRTGNLVRVGLVVVFAGMLSTCRRPNNKPGAQREFELASRATPESDIPLKDIADESSDPHNLSDGEPSIAVNPKNAQDIAVVTFSGEWGGNSATGQILAPVWRSRDSGKTWRKLDEIPPPPAFFPFGLNGPSVNLRGPTDQNVLFDQDGKLVVVAMGSWNSTINEIYIYRQTEANADSLVPSQFFGDANADQPLLASSSQSGSCKTTISAVWLRVDVARAMNTALAVGSSRVNDVAVGDNSVFPNRSARIAVAKDGRSYLVYKTIEGGPGSASHKTHFRVKASDDCGKTWEALSGSGVSVSGADAVETLFTDDFGHLLSKSLQVQARARSSDAWIATDPRTSEVYVAYLAKNPSGTMQVWVAHSADRGQMWSRNVIIDSYNSAYPEIAIAENGTVGVMYIDAEESSTRTVFRHRLARSYDHCKTWTIKTLQTMDPAKLRELVQNPLDNSNQILWGDYEGLVAEGPAFYGVFTGASIGRKVSQLDPIFFTAMASNPMRRRCCTER